MAMIDVRKIGKLYPSVGGRRGEKVAALRNINLRVEVGTVLGLLGPNGAGKTTLIKILAGLLRPDVGSGRVLGYDLLHQDSEIRARVSLVAPTADVGIDNNLTVRQNLDFWAPIYGMRGAQARTRIDELLAQLDLRAKADAWPMHISAGQRQRLALARSLIARNRLVFLDEPTNKLDLDGVRSVRAMIRDLNQNHGVTIVLTTHVMEEAEALCSAIALLRRGRLLTNQPTGDLIRSLGLTRPIAVTLSHTSQQTETEDTAKQNWYDQMGRLPGVARVTQVSDQSGARRVSPRSEHSEFTIVLESSDIRVTTPALLGWIRTSGLRLVNMRAEPITLDDVFATLAVGEQPQNFGNVML